MTNSAPPPRSALAIDAFFGVCAAELRSVRRMVRTWLFVIVVLAGGAIVYAAFSVNHAFNNGTAPRFALPGFGLLMLWALLVGLVFVASDARARDEAAQIADTLDARPVSNVVGLAGRLCAVVLIAWLPLFVLAVGLYALGLLADLTALRIALPRVVPEAPEPVSLLTFMLLDAPAALLAWGALVMALAAVLRSRWIAVAVALMLLGLHLYAIFNTPLYLLPALSGIANLGLAGSEILPRWPAAEDVAARAAALLLAGGFLLTAAGALQRRDAVPRTRCFGIAACLLAIGAAGIAALAWQAQAAHDERSAWAETHRALRDAPRLDIERISGQVDIAPGRRLAIDVEVAAHAPPDAPLDVLQFSLNPGMGVEAVEVEGAAVPHVHEDGLLTVTPAQRLAANARVVVAIRASGIPDQRFGYLDSAVDGMAETLFGSPMALLGEQASLFDANYVALTPTVRWLPAAGANFAAPADFFELALAVELPMGWHAAGAGRALEAPAEGAYRFEPDVPIVEFALLAAPFERRAMTVLGAQCELLIHPKHLHNIEYLAAFTGSEDEEGDFLEKLRERLQVGLQPGDDMPDYPHRVASLVEVPAQLRRYGGGWLMDTAQAFPGVQLLAEHGLPTARLVESHRVWMPEGQRLYWLLANVDRTGPGGIAHSVGAERNLGPFLARATGEGAAVADYLLESLTAWRLHGGREVAPAHWLVVGQSPGYRFLARALERAMGSASMASRQFLFFPMWLEDESEKVSFTGFDPWSAEHGANIIVHKGNLVVLAIQSLLGVEKALRFLALMQERHAGGTYALDDFVQAMTDVDPGVGNWLQRILHEPDLPGFLASDASVARLPEDDAGNPRYQTLVHVRNDESAPGVAGLSYRPGDGFFQWSPFVQVPGNSSVEVGVVSAAPPEEVRLETYLSLNRRIMRLRVEPLDVETIVRKPPFNGSRESAWLPPDLGIVVDDLDPGFAALSPPTRWRLRRAEDEAAADGRLEEFGRDAGTVRRWRRQADPNILIWGKYRRTLARIAAGNGDAQASFTTALPAAGRWRLHYHLPGASLSEGHYMRSRPWWNRADAFGEMDIKIVSADGESPVAFDAALATPGWNSLGTYDLPAGRVEVVVSDATTGDIVVADAVRWERAREG